MSRPVPRALALLAWLLPLLVLTQAALAGQAWFRGADLFGLHGGVGHAALATSILIAVWCWFGRARRSAALVATVVVLALVAQTGLGYAGHRSQIGIASSLHIPLGTAILAASSCVALLVSLPRAMSASADLTDRVGTG